MIVQEEHKCNVIKQRIELIKYADKWIATDGDVDGNYLPDLKFCPYCGIKLS